MRPTRLLAPLSLLAFSCATARPAPRVVPATSKPRTSSTVAAFDPGAEQMLLVPATDTVVPRKYEEPSPPPPRHHHERVISRREYLHLIRRYPLGFSPDVCRKLCRDPAALEPAGPWTWVLRCILTRTILGEPAVACHEDAVGHAELERICTRWRLEMPERTAGFDNGR